MGRLRALSLFSGCGGMDLGLQGGFEYLNNNFKELSIEILLAIDNDPYAVKIYNDNFSHECIVKDVKDLEHTELPNHDILLGGFPCQSFSILAQNPPRLGIKDEKGELFFEMCKILKKNNLDFLLLKMSREFYLLIRKKLSP